jgi:hypothetical protein
MMVSLGASVDSRFALGRLMKDNASSMAEIKRSGKQWRVA